jgi:probable F420-dependent oxidoreductase
MPTAQARPADGDRDAARRGLTVRVGLAPNPFDGDRGAPGLWELVDAMEECGYDSLWVSDSASLGGLSPLPTLAAIAARTEKLKLGTNVLVLPPRNPVMLARELATVDVLSGGRLLPAGGLGIDIAAERAALGVEPRERVARMEECIEILRALWSTEGPVDYAGRFVQLQGIELHPAPVKRRFELWLAGNAPKALARIGRLGDGWIGSFLGPHEFAAMTDLIREAAQAAGRSIDEDHYGTTLFACPSEDELPDAARALLTRRPELDIADHVAFGPDQLRELLTRFIAEGGSKYVVVPIARDVPAYIRLLREEAIRPVETPDHRPGPARGDADQAVAEATVAARR